MPEEINWAVVFYAFLAGIIIGVVWIQMLLFFSTEFRDLGSTLWVRQADLLETEQVVACYKGCQYATQPSYGIVIAESETDRVKMYRECTLACETKFLTEGGASQ